MRIAYLAKHHSGGNDDEDSIAHALELLGHSVSRLRESRAEAVSKLDGDFLLFHHCVHLKSIANSKLPKVFWCFDLIDYPDPTLAKRCKQRKQWIADATVISDVGFCTDGDWVEQDTTGKLHWLMQGADQRIVGRAVVDTSNLPQGLPRSNEPCYDLLFTGGRRGGYQRETWVQDMESTYGAKFSHHTTGLHRERLAIQIARTAINLAPDGPITACYWSNRVYNVLGFGGFLLHPYAARLQGQYDGDKEIVYYRSRGELHDLIRYYIDRPDLRNKIAQAGLARTIRDHTYVNRVEHLCRVVKEKLCL